MKVRRSLPWILLTGLVSLTAGVLLARMLAQKPVTLQSGTWLPQARAVAPFALTDLQGRPYSNAALAGHPSLLFFGFTYCPDVCPTTLAVLREVQQQHPLAHLQVLFVTVDPGRDTPAMLAHYLNAFSPDFVGLYGSDAALAPLLRSLGAIAVRQPLPGGGYTMDHSATLYLLDARGRMAAVFSPPFAAAGLAADLRRAAPALTP